MFNFWKGITVVLFLALNLILFINLLSYLFCHVNLSKSMNLEKVSFLFVKNQTELFFIVLFVTLLVLFILKKFNVVFFWTTSLLSFITINLFFLVNTDNIFIFFLTYELLLLASALIFKISSSNLRTKKVLIYFILWTQLSSFFLWLGIFLIWYNYNETSFSALCTSNNFGNVQTELFVCGWFICLAFLIKIPLWPFSFWLIKVHVEANTAFSIFLSGILIKTALVGLLKFKFLFSQTCLTFLIISIFLSLVNTTLALVNQTDFKKLIAYTTVQEMSLVTFCCLFYGNVTTTLIIKFVWMHTIMSLLLFYFVDSIFVRFKTRKVGSLLGVSLTLPKLNMVLNLLVLMFTGVPITVKFFFELLFISKLVSLDQVVFFLIIVFLQFFTIIVFYKAFSSLHFGKKQTILFDLSKSEICLYGLCFFIFFFVGLL